MTITADLAMLAALMEQGNAQLVEVLPREQYQRAHIPGAVSIPLGELSGPTARQLDPARPVIVYCQDFL